VGSVRVVVVDEHVEHMQEMAAVEDEEPVEAFSVGGADEALGERVRLRGAHRCLDDLDVFASEDGVEAAGELGVAVADQLPETRRLLLECPGELAGLLCDPSAGGFRGAAGEVDAAAAELDEEEDV
jgi:hypothetical protein